MEVNLLENERIDDLQFNGLRIIQNTKGFCFGIDAVLLANFTRVKKNTKLVDLGTGTGIIPILLAGKSSASKIIGIEIQDEVAEMASRSVKLNQLEDRVEILNMDMKDAVGVLGKGQMDLVVSNPPYIEDQVIEGLERDVKDYEPRLALAGGDDGMDFYNRIIEDAYDYLKLGGKLVFESGHDQAEKILKKMAQVGYTKAYTKKDIQGFDRLVAAYKY